MEIVKLEAIARALFHAIPYFLEYSTGQIKAGFIIPEHMKTNTELYMRLPRFSAAHVDQIYLQKEYGDSDEYKAYGLNAYPEFPIEFNEELSELAAEYCDKAHTFIMDRLDHNAEIEFDTFYNRFCIKFAKKWCEETGIAFEYMFKENE